MSTKTSFKRIALVAASALAIAGFSAVPAHAAIASVGSITNTGGTGGADAQSGFAAYTITASFTTPAVAATITVTPTLTVTPSSGASAVTVVSGHGVVITPTGGTHTTPGAVNGTTGAVALVNDGTIGTATTITYAITPDVTGTYALSLAAASTGNTITNAPLTYTLTITKNGTATAIAIANTTTDDGVALSASKRTSNPVMDTLQISAFEVVAGSSVVLHLTAVGGTFDIGDSTRVSMSNATSNFGLVVAAHTNAVTIAGAEDPLPAFIAPSVAGTYTLSVQTDNTTDGIGGFATATDLTTSVTMVVVAASGFSAGTSSAFANDAVLTATADTDDTISGTKTVNNQAGNITVIAKNADGTICATCTVGGFVIGQGKLTVATNTTLVTSVTSATAVGGAAAVRSLTPNAVDGTLGVADIAVWSDGTAGTGVVHITVTTAAGVETEIATKNVVFFGSAAKLEVSAQPFKILAAGGATSGVKTGLVSAATTTLATSPAFVVKVTDSAGNAVGGLTASLTGTSSDAAVVAAVTNNEGVLANDANATWGGNGHYVFNATSSNSATSGKTATVTISMTDPADATKKLSTTVTFTIGGSVAKEVISTDKTSYAAGEQMLVTITATDKSGNPVADGTASPALAFNKQVGGSFGASAYAAGKRTNSANTLFAPSIGGDLLLTGTGTDTAKTAITSTVSVEGDSSSSLALDAANAATDAANNAYDEAQNATQAASDALAAVTALAAQVKSLIASVKKLTAAVAKLKK